MILRLSKTLLLAAVALYFMIVVLNNLTDFDSNFQFVHHVLAMDSTFPGNRLLGRALTQPGMWTAFYWGIIAWEFVTCVLCWGGAFRLLRAMRDPAAFQKAKPLAIAALTLGCLLWFTAFITVGGEWFLMWQSHTWNGEEAAFRLFAILMLILVYLTAPEPALS